MHYTIYREGIQERNHGSTPFKLLGTADDDSRNTSKLLDRVGPPILRFIEDNVVSMKVYEFTFNNPSFYDKLGIEFIDRNSWFSYVGMDRSGGCLGESTYYTVWQQSHILGALDSSCDFHRAE